MKARNLQPLLMVTAIAIATSGCQSRESLANNDGGDHAEAEAADGGAPTGAPQSDPTALVAPASNFGGGANIEIERGGSNQAWQNVAIIDQSGAGQPMQAASISIPANWQAQGGVDWNRSVPCVGNQMRFQWQATSADGSQAFAIMPGLTWQVQGTEMQMNPCPAMPFRTAQDLLSAIVQQQRPGARILQYQPRNKTGNGPSRAHRRGRHAGGLPRRRPGVS